MASNEIKRVITIESSESLNTLNNLNTRIKELKGSMGDLDITTEEYRRVSEEVTQLENVKRNAIRGVTAAVEGSYNAYSKELSILQKHRKTLNENSEEYRNITKRVGELQTKLKDMDAEVGVFSRNVGNYQSAFDGLQGSVNGVVSKLPSLNSGIGGFAQSMNESLPNLIKSVQNYKEMSKAAGKSVSTFKALTSALLSWNTVISIGVTLVVKFADEISGFIKKLFSFNAEVDESTKKITYAEKAAKSYLKSINEQFNSISQLASKYRVLQQEWLKLGDAMDAKENFVRKNIDAFKELGLEINNVADAEKLLVTYSDTFNEALIERSKAIAAQNVAAQIYEEILKMEYGVMENPDYNSSFKAQFERDRIRPRRQEYAWYIGKSMQHREAEQRLMSGLTPPITSSQGVPFKPGEYRDSAHNPYRMTTAVGIPTGIADEAIEIEKFKRILAAKTAMLSASAEEQIAIEARLDDELATLEQIRLTEHEIILNEMLRSDELTADERIAVEQALTEAQIAQAELQLEAEEERAKKEKEIRDREVAEEKQRAEEKKKIESAVVNTTSTLLKNTAELFEEDSKARKLLNAAAIAMDTYKAAMSAWTSAQTLPPPFNTIVGATSVAASIAMGAAQLKNLWKVAEDGSNAMSSLSGAQSAPSVASSMPASYTRNLQGDNELTEMNKSTRVYVVESDITEAQNAQKVRVESASF